MQIAIIGTGNVAWHLAKACTEAGHKVEAVVGRSLQSAEELSQSFPVKICTESANLEKLFLDFVILAVPDAALADVARSIKVSPGTIVVHTSGSQPMDLLKATKGAKMGVFYPVQTFTKYKPLDFSAVPILVEGSDAVTTDMLKEFGRTLSRNVQEQDSLARKRLHLAAVFACNFTNHLLGISQEILAKGGLTTDLLQPLILETITKAEANSPFKVQTGPAARRDGNVIQEHTRMLEHNPLWQEVYLKLTQSIQDQQNKAHSATSDN